MINNKTYIFLIGNIILFTNAIFANTLTINVKNITQYNGTLYAALVTSTKNYTHVLNNNKSVLKITHTTIESTATPVKKQSTQSIILTSIPSNKYSVLLFQDLNNNQYLDQGIFGPKEPFGFSKNPTITFRSPTFKETLIPIDSNKTISIKLHP